ncbi:MAG: TetR/AcrR family transcriptional regulator [Polyangiales bacterium]
MNPRRYDAEAARDDILDAAETLFAARGFDAVSTAAIGKVAGVSQSQIHYHFDTKRKLWEAVFQRRFADYFAAQSALLRNDGSTELERLASSIRAYFSFFQANPDYGKLLGRAALDAVEAGGSLDTADEMGGELMRRGIEIIAAAQAAGTLRADVRPEFVIVGFLSLVVYWFQAGHVFLAQAGAGERAPHDSAYLDFLLKIYLRGVAAEGP